MSEVSLVVCQYITLYVPVPTPVAACAASRHQHAARLALPLAGGKTLVSTQAPAYIGVCDRQGVWVGNLVGISEVVRNSDVW